MVRTTFGLETEALNRVQVRLPDEHERPEFDLLLTEMHYLHEWILRGESLRYVAEIDGQWVALIAFSEASLHLKGRENWIGWSARQRARRLSLVVNYSRFLVLSERLRYPNLASRVLGLSYRACGFEAVGSTQGFGRSNRDFYLRHGQPKQLYVRELWPGARKLLCQSRWPEELAVHEVERTGPCPFRAPSLESLLDRLTALADARRGHGLRHRQRFVLACAAVSTLLGACGYQAFENTCKKFTQRQLKAPGCQRDEVDDHYYPPSDSAFQRVLSRIDPSGLTSIVGSWLAEQEIGALAQLAVDGKVFRGSGRQDGKPLQLLSAVTHQLRLTLDQIPIREPSIEIPALKPLLEKVLPPPGTFITADAMHCQQESAQFITQDVGGDYLFGL